jgi:hypothetical protein
MTKTEFLVALQEELDRLRVPDAQEILDEYEEHFQCKIADGYTEEEIAARLGNPADLAAQFIGTELPKTSRSKRFWTSLGIGCLDFFAFLLLAVLVAALVVFAAFAIALAAAAVCYVGGFHVASLLPYLPYGCGLLHVVDQLVHADRLPSLRVRTSDGSNPWCAVRVDGSRMHLLLLLHPAAGSVLSTVCA